MKSKKQSKLISGMNTKQYIQECIETRGGKDALSEEERKALVKLA